jgi:hypothetical protein
VLRRHAEAGPGGRAHHDRQLRLAAEHVLHLGHLIEDLVPADAHEIDEHDLDDGSQACRRSPDRQTRNPGLRYRRVDDALGAELLHEPARRSEDPDVDIDTGNKDVRIAIHLLYVGFRKSLGRILLRHQTVASV